MRRFPINHGSPWKGINPLHRGSLGDGACSTASERRMPPVDDPAPSRKIEILVSPPIGPHLIRPFRHEEIWSFRHGENVVPIPRP